METEQLLEKILVNNPDMLLPGLTLVGRQTRTEGGPLDLLGVDDDGRLVVFELKRGTLSREAVAQVIDYASFLDSKPDVELAIFISERSGAHEIDKIEDFDEWYDAKSGGQGLGALKPVRMVLVGLGVDDTTARMVRFLAKSGIDISLLTFHGFRHGGQTLLARQVQVEAAAKSEFRTVRRSLGQQERRELLDSRVMEQAELWDEAPALWETTLQMFREKFHNPRERATRGNSEGAKYRLNFLIRPATGRLSRYAAVQLVPWNKTLEVIFYPVAVSLCLEEFTQLRREIPFHTWPENDPKKDDGILEIKFDIKSMREWEIHKEKLSAVTLKVYQAYSEQDE